VAYLFDSRHVYAVLHRYIMQSLVPLKHRALALALPELVCKLQAEHPHLFGLAGGHFVADRGAKLKLFVFLSFLS